MEHGRWASTTASWACRRWSSSADLAPVAAILIRDLGDRAAGRARRSSCWTRAAAAAIRALKGGTTMAEAMGISTYRYKGHRSSCWRRCWPRVSGWLFAHFQRTVNPRPSRCRRASVPVHGGAGRRRPGLGRLHRRRTGQADRGSAQDWLPRPSAPAATTSHRLRHGAGGGAEVRAPRACAAHRAPVRALPAGEAPGARLGRRRAAAQRACRRRASCCSTSTRCASSSAAGGGQRRRRSRSAPARSSA